jgi:hypothetical protein
MFVGQTTVRIDYPIVSSVILWRYILYSASNTEKFSIKIIVSTSSVAQIIIILVVTVDDVDYMRSNS